MSEVDDVDAASWEFMSVTEMDASFIEKRERMKVLIGRRDNRIRADAVKAERKRKPKNGDAIAVLMNNGKWGAET